MADYINKLPDDIFCYILSLLTIRDTFRVKSLSSRWKDLPDCRSVIRFDAYTILGEDTCDIQSLARRSKFIKAIDQFLKIWTAQKTSALKIKFDLGNKYASHINGWIASVCGKGIEELDLDFSFHVRATGEVYVFPYHLLDTERGSCLKHLRLTFCDLRSIYGNRTSWLSKLSTIELTDVRLHLADLECILSTSLNLESLSLTDCRIKGYLRFQHPFLKKIVISDDCDQVELICPRLETFEFSGRSDIKFFGVPLLTEVSIKRRINYGGLSPVLSDLAREVPRLETLSLWVNSEVQPLPPNVTMSCLKRVDLFADIPIGFNLCTITNLLYASPVLQELSLKVIPRGRPYVQPPQQQFEDRPHFHLKEVKFSGVLPVFSAMELMEYLLRNGVSLQQMIFIVGAEFSPICRGHPKFTRLQNVNPTVELIFI